MTATVSSAFAAVRAAPVEAPGLLFRRDGALGHRLDGRGEVAALADRGLGLGGEVCEGVLRQVSRDLDLDPGGGVDRRRLVEQDSELPGEAGLQRRQGGLDGERENVHALDDEHVVGAAEDLETERRAAAFAGLGEDLHEVVGAQAQDGTGAAPERGVDELADRALLESALLECEGLGRLRVDQLGQHQAGRSVVEAGPELALAAVEAELADPVEVGRS
jgi:hypothetical protein